MSERSEQTEGRTTDPQPALLPCPFCGGEAAVRDDGGFAYFVACQKCYGRTRMIGQPDEARTFWNRRTAPEPAPEPTMGSQATDAECLSRTLAWLAAWSNDANIPLQAADEAIDLFNRLEHFRERLAETPATAVGSQASQPQPSPLPRSAESLAQRVHRLEDLAAVMAERLERVEAMGDGLAVVRDRVRRLEEGVEMVNERSVILKDSKE